MIKRVLIDEGAARCAIIAWKAHARRTRAPTVMSTSALGEDDAKPHTTQPSAARGLGARIDAEAAVETLAFAMVGSNAPAREAGQQIVSARRASARS